MNHLPAAPHMPPNFRNQPGRRQNEYHYPPATHHHHHHHHPHHHHPPPPPPPLPHHLAYTGYVHPQQYQVAPIPIQHYPQQWYQPYQHYGPPPPRPYNQQAPLIVSSHPHAQPVVPVTRQLPPHQPPPTRTPQPETSTPSTLSRNVISPSTTPTSTSVVTSTPPVTTVTKVPPASSPVSTPVTVPSERTLFSPPLPWLSVPESQFPPRAPRRRRKRKPTAPSANEVELPIRPQEESSATVDEPSVSEPTTLGPIAPTVDEGAAPSPVPSPTTATAEPETLPPDQVTPTPTSNSATSPVQTHGRSATRTVIPAVPIVPVNKAPPPRSSIAPPAAEGKSPSMEPSATPEPKPYTSSSEVNEIPPIPTSPIKQPPKSWAELLRPKDSAVNGTTAGTSPASDSTLNGILAPKAITLADMLRLYNVDSGSKISFLEPRGLRNTGNMCYMNSILQILVFCVPFYEFLDQVSKKAAHSFKSDTPLMEAMIMFMREYPLIDVASSVEQLRLRLKDSELERYGESFIPEYVYDVIKTLPRFSTMRRGHQQDAEEFLGFLLEGLHDECVHVMSKAVSDSASTSSADPLSSPQIEHSELNTAVDNGWMEVGPKQKASVTRSSGLVAVESPITKIFGGKLRSVFRVHGVKDSVTLEPYQPLQLDIGAPNVSSITDALKGLTRSETLNGEFQTPRGLATTATKQVFIETLPPVLILHLKRFQYENAGGTQKIWKKVGYPLDLEIPKEAFQHHQRAALSIRPGGLPKYRLIAVVYHHGKNASGGHYTVDVRRQEGREWMRIDDTIIRRIRSEDVAAEGAEEDPKVLAKALEQHKQDEDAGKSIYKATGFGGLLDEGDAEDEEEEDSRGGWSQVNGSATSPTQGPANTKNWSSVANGTASPNSNVSGKQTPRGAASSKFSIKDNKVAYILFYQQVNA